MQFQVYRGLDLTCRALGRLSKIEVMFLSAEVQWGLVIGAPRSSGIPTQAPGVADEGSKGFWGLGLGLSGLGFIRFIVCLRFIGLTGLIGLIWCGRACGVWDSGQPFG